MIRDPPRQGRWVWSAPPLPSVPSDLPATLPTLRGLLLPTLCLLTACSFWLCFLLHPWGCHSVPQVVLSLNAEGRCGGRSHRVHVRQLWERPCCVVPARTDRPVLLASSGPCGGKLQRAQRVKAGAVVQGLFPDCHLFRSSHRQGLTQKQGRVSAVRGSLQSDDLPSQGGDGQPG